MAAASPSLSPSLQVRPALHDQDGDEEVHLDLPVFPRGLHRPLYRLAPLPPRQDPRSLLRPRRQSEAAEEEGRLLHRHAVRLLAVEQVYLTDTY